MKLKIYDSDKSVLLVEVDKPIITQEDIDMYLATVVDEHGDTLVAEVINE